MKKIKIFLSGLFFVIFATTLTSCGCMGCKAIELMGAGDRIHDSYTFANTGVKITEKENNIFEISGSVEKITNEKVKEEFSIDSDIEHIVAFKLTAINSKVVKDEVEISVNGLRVFDAEHLNGSDYTFFILEAKKGETATISVKWNKDDSEKVYVINFSNQLELK